MFRVLDAALIWQVSRGWLKLVFLDQVPWLNPDCQGFSTIVAARSLSTARLYKKHFLFSNPGHLPIFQYNRLPFKAIIVF